MTRRIHIASALALALASACTPTREVPPATASPPRPPGGLTVQAGESLQARVDAAPEGAVLCLARGEHAGPLRIHRRLVLWGPRDALVRSPGEGTTIDVAAAGTQVLGFTVSGSGGRFDLVDAAVRVRASDVRVEGVRVEGALFGILVERAARVVVRGNEVEGSGEMALGLRGDAIRLWETTDSLVEGNVVRRARDLVVWYSSRNRIAGNAVSECRYGTHFMYSHDNQVLDNRYLDNVVGLFVMYSRGIAVRGNRLLGSGGSAGVGLGLKESGNIVAEGNLFVADTAGTYLDTSPLDAADTVTFRGNAFRLCDTAIAFHSSPHRVTFAGNRFRGNATAVRVAGGGDALDADFTGNEYDDYQGYDLDGDGTGDVPFELRSLSGQMESRRPELGFFRGTPALTLVDVTAQVLPLLRPKQLLLDRRPSLGLCLEVSDAD